MSTTSGKRGQAITGLARLLGIAFAGATAVVVVTWGLEHAIPPPYSGYLALTLVGLAIIQLYKLKPAQRAERLFRLYLKARARGAGEAEARTRLLTQLYGDSEQRGRAARALETAWTGGSEKERVVGGVAALLARRGTRLDPTLLGPVYDRTRDRVKIPGWEALPPEFVGGVRDGLDELQRKQLDALVERYRLFDQRFFGRPSALGAAPAAAVVDFARLLHSLGNRVAADEPGDAERAYRLSLALRPASNLAHAGLALLLERTGRTRDAAREARMALDVLDDLARRAANLREPPATEDISPFRSPVKLREALERVATTG